MPTPRQIDPTGEYGGVLLLNFRAPVGLVAALKRISRSKGMTLSNYLRELCWQAVEDENEDAGWDEDATT